MKSTLILNATVVNEGEQKEYDVLIEKGRIARIDKNLQHISANTVIDASNLHLMPGMIDDQVHFREPGLTHKADIGTESAAAVAGGTTSFMEMPNVSPPTTDSDALKKKFEIAKKKSHANFSFYLGATNNNLDEILSVDTNLCCGIKVFMGASTGNLLVDNVKSLEKIFNQAPILVATHCEDNQTITQNFSEARKRYGKDIPVTEHPVIRSEEACYLSSSFAVELAKKNNTNLHVLHLTTEKELELFSDHPITSKRITAEACVHHLWFSEESYLDKGSLIKCNPAIKKPTDRQALLNAVNAGKIDIIATDHAPHTIEEKEKDYSESPAGIPLVQHALLSLLDHYHNGTFKLEKIVQMISHNPALGYCVKDRGFIREGYFADIVLFDLKQTTSVSKTNLLYKCGWSPFEGHQFRSKISSTFVNGVLAFDGNQVVSEIGNAKALEFER